MCRLPLTIFMTIFFKQRRLSILLLFCQTSKVEIIWLTAMPEVFYTTCFMFIVFYKLTCLFKLFLLYYLLNFSLYLFSVLGIVSSCNFLVLLCICWASIQSQKIYSCQYFFWQMHCQSDQSIAIGINQ